MTAQKYAEMQMRTRTHTHSHTNMHANSNLLMAALYIDFAHHWWKKYKAPTPSTCLPNESLCVCFSVHCVLICYRMFAFPCQSFLHTKACFYSHHNISDCDFWHFISGACVCLCVCACEAQFVSLDMRFECCSDGACLFFVGMCYIHFNQEFIPTHSVINCSSRSRHIWIIWRNETIRQMANKHTHADFNYYLY